MKSILDKSDELAKTHVIETQKKILYMDYSTLKIRCIKCGEEKVWVEFPNKKLNSTSNALAARQSDTCKACTPKKKPEHLRIPSFLSQKFTTNF